MPGGKTGLNARVHEYLMKRQGQTVFVSDMMRDCDGNKTQIQTAISRCKMTYGIPIVSLVSGSSYKVGVISDDKPQGHPAPEKVPPTPAVKSGRIFEEVGQARDGVVIQDTNGKLYLAKEL